MSKPKDALLRKAYDFLAEMLSKKGSGRIVPSLDNEFNIRFREVEEFFGVDSETAVELLDDIASMELLVKEFYDKILLCPSCNSGCVRTRYLCPYCGSRSIVKHRIIEHFKCGTIDNEESFRRNGELVCPGCNVKLEDASQDYRVVGVWCECRSCGRSFDNPVVEHECVKCGSHFTFKDAVYRDVFVYSISDKVKKELKRKVGDLIRLKLVAEEMGFEAHIKMSLQGATGILHSFDLVAIKVVDSEEKFIAIDLVLADEVDERHVAAVFTKAYDTKPFKSIIIGVPKVSSEAKRLVEFYGITLIEAPNIDEAEEKLKSKLKAVLEELKSKSA